MHTTSQKRIWGGKALGIKIIRDIFSHSLKKKKSVFGNIIFFT